jgi:hypothetical protein
MNEGSEEAQSEGGFDWGQAHVTHLYPPPDILAEMGRVTIAAAARVDFQLALVLLAIKHSKNFEALLKKNSGELYKALKVRLAKLFEGPLLESSTENLEELHRRIEVRHAVTHSIWTPDDRSDLFSVEQLLGIRSQEELDSLMAERGKSADWKTLHPKTGVPGPQTLNELEKARVDLEEAAEWLKQLRFILASALFAGKPPGARQVLDPRSFN